MTKFKTSLTDFNQFTNYKQILDLYFLP